MRGGTHEGQTEKGTSNQSSKANRSQLGAFWGAAEAARKRGGAGGRGHSGLGSMLRWGDGNHTAHTDGHTATLGSLYNVNGGRLYPTLLSFMHLGGKHSSIDSKLWPVIGVGFGVPDFLFFLPLFLYLCFENTKPKNEARIRGANSAPG